MNGKLAGKNDVVELGRVEHRLKFDNGDRAPLTKMDTYGLGSNEGPDMKRILGGILRHLDSLSETVNIQARTITALSKQADDQAIAVSRSMGGLSSRMDSLDDQFSASARASSTLLKRVETLTEGVEGQASVAERNNNAVLARVENLAARVDIHSTTSTRTATTFAEQVRELSDRMDALSADGTTRFATLTETIDAHAARSERALADVTNRSATSTAAVMGIQKDLAALSTRVDQQTATSTRNSSKLTTTVQELSDKVKGLADESTTSSSTMKSTIRGLTVQMENLVADSAKDISVVKQSVRALTEKLAVFAKSSGGAQTAMSTRLETVAATATKQTAAKPPASRESVVTIRSETLPDHPTRATSAEAATPLASPKPKVDFLPSPTQRRGCPAEQQQACVQIPPWGDNRQFPPGYMCSPGVTEITESDPNFQVYQGACLGRGHAARELGKRYRADGMSEKNVVAVVRWFWRGIELLDWNSAIQLAAFTGEGGSKAVIEWVRAEKRRLARLAERAFLESPSNPWVQCRWALLLLEGIGVPQSRHGSLESLQTVAKRYPRFGPAESFLGVYHLNGWAGLKKDEPQAFVHFRSAAVLGFPPAQWWTGYCLRNGLGVDVDKSRGDEWDRKAREQGFQ